MIVLHFVLTLIFFQLIKSLHINNTLGILFCANYTTNETKSDKGDDLIASLSSHGIVGCTHGSLINASGKDVNYFKLYEKLYYQQIQIKCLFRNEIGPRSDHTVYILYSTLYSTGPIILSVESNNLMFSI